MIHFKKNIMIKIKFFICCLFMGLIMFSCSDEQDGQWDDNIKLSTKTITMPASQSSFTVNTQSTNYWLSGISLDGDIADLSHIDHLSKNWVVETTEYEIQRKEDGKKIAITMNANTSGADRVLIISFQSGNYFDGIRVTQAK